MGEPVRYRRTHDGKRFRVVMLGKWEGFVVRWSQHCSGCTEYGEFESAPERGAGCEECGYQGRTRRAEWVPFDAHEYNVWSEARWKRRERLIRCFEQRKRELKYAVGATRDFTIEPRTVAELREACFPEGRP